MVQMLSKLHVADNSGAKKVQCIKVLGGAGKMSANIGDVIVVSIKSALPGAKVKPGEVHRAIIVRTKKGINRSHSTIKFDRNNVVLIDKGGEPIGSRVFGPITRELRSLGYSKIVSLAPEVL